MLSAKEMRCRIGLGLLLFWTTLAWTLYDQLQHPTGRLDWSRLVGMGFGALMLTRVAYGVLRSPRQDG